MSNLFESHNATINLRKTIIQNSSMSHCIVLLNDSILNLEQSKIYNSYKESNIKELIKIETDTNITQHTITHSDLK